MNRGYVHLWRMVKDSAVFQNEGLFKVFVWCLLRANYREQYVLVKTGRGCSEVKLLPPCSTVVGKCEPFGWRKLLKSGGRTLEKPKNV